MIRTNLFGLAATLAILAFTSVCEAAPVEQRSYGIEPGATYTYKPGFGPGIPGGQPSPLQLDFGVGGTFDVFYDRMAATATLLNMQLVLTGNEAIQMNPPGTQPVTASRVEDYLEARIFENMFVLAPWDQYRADDTPNLFLYDFLNDLVWIRGGFDHTPTDGTAMQFSVNARIALIPEPTAFALAASSLFGVLTIRRRFADSLRQV